MSRSIDTAAPAILLGFMLLSAGGAMAQTAAPPGSPQTTTPLTPSAQTPPGGIARGVVSPPANVDPEMVTRPPASAEPGMSVIKPPVGAR